MIVHNKGGDDTGSAGSGRAPRAVEIGLLFRGGINVYHQGHVRNINPSSRNIRGDEDSGTTGAEIFNGPGAGVLSFVTVEGDSVDPIAGDFFQLSINRMLGAHEHDDFCATSGGIDS